MEITSMPKAVLFGYTTGRDKLTFIGREGDITLEMKKYRNILVKILSHCNGKQTIATIRKSFPSIGERDFLALVKIAEEFGIIIDSRDLYQNFHKDSSNPAEFARNLSPQEVKDLVVSRKKIPTSHLKIDLPKKSNGSHLLKLCGKRKTSRTFSGKPLSLREVSSLLRAMYTVGDQRSTPSAGQLYPLGIYVAVIVGTSGLSKGLYQYDPERSQLLAVKNARISNETITRMLNGYVAKNASLVIFVTGDIERAASKYANRAYRFVLMECGHVAQNAQLFCAESGNLGILEYGGFNDKITSEILGIDYPKNAALLALVVGRKSKNGKPSPSYIEEAWNLGAQILGEGKPIEYLSVNNPSHGNYKIPRVQVFAKYKPFSGSTESRITNEDRFASGVALTTDEAQVKALSEGYERHVSGRLRIDKIAAANDLTEDWFDPRKAFPLRNLALERGYLDAFDPEKKLEWVYGKRYSTGKKILVPIDLVFYPLTYRQLGRKLFYSSSSSGVAAHTDYEAALRRSILELVERDALAVTWYSMKHVTAIPLSELPEDIQFRANHWIASGWNVKFLNITLDSVPVVLAVIYSSKKFPSFIAGASANHNCKVAAAKAWDETELFLSDLLKKNWKAIKRENVYTPMDHGKFYVRPDNMRYLHWLLDSKEKMPMWDKKQHQVDLLSKFDPVVVDLARADASCGLHVVRVISEKLLPINFGYCNEHIGHPRMKELGLAWKRKFPAPPHFFA